jgi:protein TonB
MRRSTQLTCAALGALVLSGVAKAAPNDAPAKADAAAPKAAEPSLNGLVWLRIPTEDEMAFNYPRDAVRLLWNGDATMRCKLKADGSLTGCKILSERPANMGFGRATLGLASKFRMPTTNLKGESVAGATVTIPVGWRISGESESAPGG